MNPKFARKLYSLLFFWNISLIIVILDICIKMMVDWYLPLDEYQIRTVPTNVKLEMKDSLVNYSYCWEVKILEEKEEKIIIMAQPFKQEILNASNLPYMVVTIMYSTSSDKSYAVLYDKQSQKQILIKHGQKYQEYKVVELSAEGLKLAKGDKIAFLPYKKQEFIPKIQNRK